MLLEIIGAILSMVGSWMIFKKMGRQGWEGIVPIYSTYVLCKVLYGNGWKCLLLLIPGNMLIHSIAGTTSVTAVLPPKAALVLIVLATLLTILGGLIPARSAAKCNPVTALRSE